MAVAALWFFIVPIIGAFAVRRTWRLFRSRFDELRLAPILDYRSACGLDADGAVFRFFGGFESTGGQTLWIRSESMTIPVELTGAKIFLLPIEESEKINERESVPRPIKWKQVSEVSEGARIFVGGRANARDGRARFESGKNDPLLVILYDGQERSLLMRAVRAGRQKNEYWNSITPYSLALGIFSELLMALSYANRPAFSAAFSAALTAAFGPLIPFLPPGVLLSALASTMWGRGRAYRALRDLVKLPLRHLPPGTSETVLPDGSSYGVVRLNEEQFAGCSDLIPKLPPEAEHSSARETWHCYGALVQGEEGKGLPVSEPDDPSAVFAAVADAPEQLSRYYSLRARILEMESAAAFTGGLLMNAAVAYALISLIKNTF